MSRVSECKIVSEVKLGKNIIIEDYVIIGVRPTKESSRGPLVIGDNSKIRSHTVIYSGNIIGDHFQTGHGALIRENNIIGSNVSIGSHSVVERDNRIGNNVRIHSNCFIPEFVIIEDNVWIGPSLTILNVLHPPCPKFEECVKNDPVVIKENAKIGGNVTIAPGVTIGKNSLVGAGAVVVDDVPDNVVVTGSPSKIIKRIDQLTCKEGYYKNPYEWERERK